jgi:amidase
MPHRDAPFWRWDAVAIARAIRLGAVSAREVAEDALARLAAANPAINAVVLPLEREALEAAGAVDAARARGEALPPLAGVPVTTKINADQRGLPTSNGVVAFRDVIAAEDSPVVANLRRAGAVVIGRTNTPAFSWRWFTDNALHGRTLNPWDAGVTPGGSSGGAAAAVAAGIGAVAHGNDIGGSVRYPAYACGVAGLRPSAGRIPAFNPSAAVERSLSAQILSTQGPLARRVGDLRLALEAMAAPDPRDPWQMPVPLAGPPLAARPIRVALCADPAGGGVHPSVSEAVAGAGRALEAAGYAVEERAPPDWDAVAADWDSFIHAEASVFMRQAFERHADPSAGAIFARMATRPLPAIEDYMRLLARRATHQRAWALWMAERAPLLVVPSSNEPPFPQGLDETDFDRVFRAQSPLFPTVLLGLPSVSVPTGVVDGLPTGVQVVAPRWREDLALDAAEAIEAAWPMPTPIDPRR